MKDTLILLTGLSGCGKDYVCSILEKEYKIPNLKSYTTRPRRYPDENGYTFIDYKDVNKYFNKVFQGFVDIEKREIYFTTFELLENILKNSNSTTLIVTPQSVIPIAEMLKEYNILYFHINTDEHIRIKNMLSRGDSPSEIEKRINNMDKEIEKHYKQFLLDVNDDSFFQNNLKFFNCSSSNDVLEICKNYL